MRPLSLPLLGLLTLGLFAPVWAAEPLAAVLPADTKFFFSVSNLGNLNKASEHPLVKSVTTGELGKALKPMMDKLSGEVDAASAAIFKEETGLTAAELMAKFNGPAAAGVSMNLGKAMAKDSGTSKTPPDFGITMVADFAGDEALMQKLLMAFDKLEEKSAADKKKEAAAEDKKAEDEDEDEKDADADEEEDKPSANWPEDYEEAVTEVEGAKVHEWTLKNPDKMDGPPMSWTVSGGKAALSVGKVDLKDLVTRMAKKSDEGSLASTGAWKSMPSSISDSDVLAGVNLESLLGEAQEAMRLQMEKGELNTGGLPINPLQAWTGAGLDQLRMAFIDTNLEAEDAAMHMGLTYAEKPAILKIYAATGPGTPPAFVPSDVQEISWGTLDWGAMFDNLKELAVALSPMAAGGLEMGLTEAKKTLGVDIRADLLGQMGDDLWSVSHLDPEAADKADADKDADADDVGAGALSALALTEGQSQVIGIALKDSKAFALSLKTMFNTLAPDSGLFDEREFMGKTIYQFKGLPANMPISWLIENDTWIFSIGKPGLLDKVLGGMAKKPATPLIDQPHVKAALAKLPEGGVSTSYADAGQMIDLVFGLLKPMLADELEGDAADAVDSLPDKLNLKWHTVSRMYLGDKSTDVRIRLSAQP